ncbi:MAG: ATP-binding cassette domain-containing protein [Desulfurobacteriaceae bacterium]
MLKVSVRKEFKSFSLDVNFKSESQVTALFAPSGSGKSLTLQAVAGLIEPDSGRIEVNGKLLFDSERGVNLPPQERKVGYLFQEYALFPHMTVHQNITYGAKNRRRVEELLKILKIENLKDKYPKQISGGQKQRVALARALASQPEILLLDEPFSALDRNLKEELWKELKGILEIYRIPTILVTHDPEELFELAEWIVVMNNGKVIQEGEPNEVFFNPESVETAKLLGHRSFVEGTVKEVGKFTAVELPSGRVLKCRKGNFKVGEKVYVSILPNSLALSLADETNRVEMVVKRVEKGREISRVYATFEGKEVELHIPSSLSPNFLLQEGRESTFYLSAHHLPVIGRKNEEES